MMSPTPSQVFFHKPPRALERLGTVAHRVFDAVTQLGEGPAESFDDKQRVITETCPAFLLETDQSPAGSRHHADQAFAVRQGDRTTVARPTLFQRNPPELAQKPEIVFLIRGVRAGIAGRINAGTVTEGFDL